MYGQVPERLSVLTSTKRFYRTRTRRTRKNNEQRTSTKIRVGAFLAVFSERGTFSVVPGIGGTVWTVSRVGGTVRTVSRVGGTLWAVLEVGGTF